MRMGTRSVPIEYYILQTAARATPQSEMGSVVVGYLADKPILSTVVDSTGSRYRYVGLASRLPDGRYDVQALSPGEWIVEPGLIYRSQAASYGVRRSAGRLAGLASALHIWMRR